MKTNTNHLVQIIGIYIIIAVAGFFSWKFSPFESEILSFLLADIVMTIVCFAFSILKKNSSVYDAYWSVIPFFFAMQWAYIYWEIINLFHIIAFVVISLWSWRLTLNWVRSWSDFSHEDWRYVDLKKKNGKFYPIVNFLGIHLFPTMLVFGGMLPLFYSFHSVSLTPNFIIFSLGVVISLAGTGFEFFADNQLAKFKVRNNPKKEDLLNTGIWSVVRHPNYLGEMLFWIGLFVIGLSFGAPLWTAVGCISMISLFVFISIPMKEERMEKRRPQQFEAYKKNVPLLIPFTK